MVVVAEGAGSAPDIAAAIHEKIGLDPRVTVLGHIQRGGSPSARDRVMGTRMGYFAVDALASGKTNRVICSENATLVDVDIEEGLSRTHSVNPQQFLILEAMTNG